MALAFRSADLIVARAGASMLGEGPAFGVPLSLFLIHMHGATKSQRRLPGRTRCSHTSQRRHVAKDLLPTVRQLLFDDRRLAAMAQAAWKLDRPQAAADLAQLLQLLVT